MNMSWRTPYKGKIETLKLKRDPMRGGLGHYEDTEGNTWDITCIFGGVYTKNGKPYVNARMVDSSPYYSTASDSHPFGFHKWLPYYFEVVKEQVENG